MTEDNSHAGQGPVLLDIGGDIGALIVDMPAGLVGYEIEIRPVGTTATGHHHHHDDDHGHSHEHGHLVHVGVVGRPANGRTLYSAVFGELHEGTYELYVRPDGPGRLTETVRGGEVTEASWPR